MDLFAYQPWQMVFSACVSLTPHCRLMEFYPYQQFSIRRAYWLAQLATFLDANLTTFNANASFNTYTNTSEGPASYIGSTYSDITNVDQYRDLGLPFREQYIAKFGRAPYWNPQTRARWNRAATLPTSSYTTAIERTKTFQSWFRETLTPTCESTLVLYPMGAGTEDYRDIYTTAPGGIFAAGLP